MEQLKEFIVKAGTDKELIAKREALGEKINQPDELVKLAAEFGFSITVEDIEQYKADFVKFAETRELSEDQLETVAGGGSANRYDPKTCKNMTTTKYECVGFLQLCWCDHLRVKELEETIIPFYYYSCAMHAFPPYLGDFFGGPL